MGRGVCGRVGMGGVVGWVVVGWGWVGVGVVGWVWV